MKLKHFVFLASLVLLFILVRNHTSESINLSATHVENNIEPEFVPTKNITLPSATPPPAQTVEPTVRKEVEFAPTKTELVLINNTAADENRIAHQITCDFRYTTRSSSGLESEFVSLYNHTIEPGESFTYSYDSAGKCVEAIDCTVSFQHSENSTSHIEQKITKRIPKLGCIAMAEVTWESKTPASEEPQLEE